ncbi:MAG TPA: hypothetical protein VOA41_00060 [Candidatus Dormibacteraeota bacterium]|nr:hypothetical protein [Candidatus Dormibacteraeota bacterium]
MKPIYNIFRKFPHSRPIWVAAVAGLEHARLRVLKVIRDEPGHYFVYDPRRNQVVLHASEIWFHGVSINEFRSIETQKAKQKTALFSLLHLASRRLRAAY